MQTGERAPLWCTLLVFIQAYDKCFMPPIIVHQAKDYSQDLRFSIPLDCTVHHKTFGYMDRYRWLKSMTQLSNVCDASPVKNHILFFDGPDSHFNEYALIQMKRRSMQPFVLKAVNSINYQPKDNLPNSKLKSLYNKEKTEGIIKYGTTKFLPRQMKSILVEAWDTFKVSPGKVIRDSIAKTKLPPPHSFRLNIKYPGMCCLLPSIFWTQG